MVRAGLAATLLLSIAGSAAGVELAVEPLVFDLTAPAAQPNVVADAARDRFVLSWQSRDAEGCSALHVRTMSRDGEAGPVRHASHGCNWFVNWADFPSVAIADNGDWLTFWLEKSGPGTYAYDIRLVRSRDEGRTWSAPITPHRDRTETEHGFVSMLPIGADRVLVVWLDGRNTAKPQGETGGGHESRAGHGSHGGHAAAAMTLRSAIVDRRMDISHEQEIDPDVCSCCPTDLVGGTGGPTVVYRDRTADEIRDIHHARWTGRQWTASTTIHPDHWKIAACPVNGPAAAVDDRGMAVIWPTFDVDRLSVRARRVGASEPPVLLEDSKAALGRPDIARWAGGFLATWIGEDRKAQPVLRLVRLDADLVPHDHIDVATLPPGRGTGMPKLASLSGVAVLLWTEPDPALGREARAGRIRGVRISDGGSAAP
jgi:hypothetical protein